MGATGGLAGVPVITSKVIILFGILNCATILSILESVGFAGAKVTVSGPAFKILYPFIKAEPTPILTLNPVPGVTLNPVI